MNDPLFKSLCTRETLFNGWQRVKEKHSSGGIDRQTIEDYAANLEKNIGKLSEDLESGKYIQQPYLEFFIPKNETEKRRLGMLTVSDKIVQTSAAFILNPVFESSYLNVSYAYRSKKGPVKAINRVRHLINVEKYTWLASCDIDNFFDTIPHDLLFSKLGAFIKSQGLVELIKMFVMMGRVDRHNKWKDNNTGIPQGGVISPALANFYLYQLDKLMVDSNYGFVRYADDFIILCKSENEAKEALLKAGSLLTNHLKLKLNEGYKVTPVSDSFEFLGIKFTGSEISLSEKKYKRLVFKMTEASQTGNEIITNKLIEVIKGINNFYSKLIPQTILCSLDDELMAVLKNRASKSASISLGKNQLQKELHKIDFLAKEHNFKRQEYIEQSLEIAGVKKPGKIIAPGGKKDIDSTKAVKKRKHEYRKLESAGFELAVNTPGTWIGKRDNRLIVKHKEHVVHDVALLNLKSILIQSEGVVISSNAIEACSQNRITIVFLKQNGSPYALVHNPDWNDAETGSAQLEAYKNGKAFIFVKEIVRGKIANQVNLLKYYGKYNTSRNEEFATAITESIPQMNKFSDDVDLLQCESLDDFRLKIMAYEGLASARYWNTIGIIINKRYCFEGRERQGATDLINCMLNYGYGILYAKVTEALIRSGLSINLSYLHKPEHGRPSLVYDLIEEFRQQVVDRVIIALAMKTKNLKSEEGRLDDHTKKIVVKKLLERLNGIEVFRRKEMRMYEVIYAQAHSLCHFLKGDTKSYKPYIKKW